MLANREANHSPQPMHTMMVGFMYGSFDSRWICGGTMSTPLFNRRSRQPETLCALPSQDMRFLLHHGVEKTCTRIGWIR
jgi:hypothetical protein